MIKEWLCKRRFLKMDKLEFLDWYEHNKNLLLHSLLPWEITDTINRIMREGFNQHKFYEHEGINYLHKIGIITDEQVDKYKEEQGFFITSPPDQELEMPISVDFIYWIHFRKHVVTVELNNIDLDEVNQKLSRFINITLEKKKIKIICKKSIRIGVLCPEHTKPIVIHPTKKEYLFSSLAEQYHS